MSEQPSLFHFNRNLHQQQMTLDHNLKFFEQESDVMSPAVKSPIFQSASQSFDCVKKYLFQPEGEQFGLNYNSFSISSQPIKKNKIASNCEKNKQLKVSQNNKNNTQLQPEVQGHQIKEKSVSPIKERANVSQFFYIVWKITVIASIITLLTWVPLQIGFSLLNSQNYFGTLPAIIIFLNIVRRIWKKILFFKTLKISEIQLPQRVCHNMLDSHQFFIPFIQIMYLLSYVVIQLYNSNDIIISMALICHLFLGLKKLGMKINQLSNYFSFDYNIYFFILKILLFVHYCSCIWHLIGVSAADSWISELDIRESDNLTRYCYSFYWSTSVLLNMGTGNFRVMSKIELIYSSIIMFISIWVFSSILFHTFTAEIDNYTNAQHIKQYLNSVNDLFKQRNLSFVIKKKIRQYFRKHCQNVDNRLVLHILQQNVMSKLSPALREELQYEMKTQALKKCQILSRFSQCTMQNLIQHMQYIYKEPNELISMTQSSLYFIEEGQIEVKEYGKTAKYLKGGDYFGQYSFFSGKLTKTQYISTHKSYLYQVSQLDFLSLIRQNPADYELYMFINHSVQHGNYKIINMACQFCNSQRHQIQDCPIINYKPNILKLIQRENQGFQERAKFKRGSQINHRINNQTFRKLIINQSQMITYRLKQGSISFDNDSSEELAYKHQQYSQSVESKQQSIDQLLNFLQFQSERQGSQSPQKQQTYYPQQKISEQPFEFTARSVTDPQGELIQQEKLIIPQTEQLKVNISKEGKVHKPANSNAQQWAHQNITKITDDDSLYQACTKAPDKEIQYTNPQRIYRKSSYASTPSNNLVIFDSGKQISTIQQIAFEPINFPSKVELLDLSRFNNNANLDTFERMYQYDIYFHFGNANLIIQKYQLYLSLKYYNISKVKEQEQE